MADAVDWSNPCERFAALSKAYYSLVTGALETEIRTRTLDALGKALPKGPSRRGKAHTGKAHLGRP